VVCLSGMGGIVKGLRGEGLRSAEYYMNEAVLTVLNRKMVQVVLDSVISRFSCTSNEAVEGVDLSNNNQVLFHSC